jgi:hypothetical protein
VNFWNVLIYGEAALLATAFFYVVLRWRRSPMAVRGMAFVAALCFIAGVLAGIWFYHLAASFSGGAATVTPTTSPPAPSPSSARAASATAKPTTQPTPRPTPSITAKTMTRPPAIPMDWLAKLNFYRSLAKVAPVAEDEKLSRGDQLHARYLVKNRVPPDSRMHDEDPTNPWFTAEGLAAARMSDVIDPCAGCAPLSPAQAINWWVAAPFHRFSVLNLELKRIGYGEYQEAGMKANVISIGEVSFSKAGTIRPIMFPGDGATASLDPVSGEWPDPMSACAGLRPPGGLPVTLALGPNVEAIVEKHRFTEDGRVLEHCAFDASTYTNPDAAAQQWGRNILKGFGGVVLIPRAPLTPGRRYAVDLRVSGQNFRWSFSVAR